MGLFDSFKKKKSSHDQAPANQPESKGPFGDATQVTAKPFTGDEDLEVVGESYRQAELWYLIGGITQEHVRQDIVAILLPEPENQYDPNAIAVYIEGHPVGYLGRDDAARLTPGLKNLIQEFPGRFIALFGVIAGGGVRSDGLGRLGVFLKYDPTDFGLTATRGRSVDEPVQFGLRTGLSNAVATDEADDTYDLSWMNTLSSDGPRALRQLRELATSNTEPISRHFIFAELEQLLYGYRDDLPGALDEYDEWAERHHQELQDGLRQALIDKFQALPLLDTYRQSCIRHSKAKNYETAVLWAERGIAMYGDDAFKDEWVADLEKRASQGHARLEPGTPRKATGQTPNATGTSEAGEDFVETLTCQSCGKDFERVRTRGRKPHQCLECRE